MTKVLCVRHGTPPVDGGGCLVCEAEAAQRRVASAIKACPHAYASITARGLVCTACNAPLECPHSALLEWPNPTQLGLPSNGVLGGLRQCSACKAIGLDAGTHIAWMAPRPAANETKG